MYVYVYICKFRGVGGRLDALDKKGRWEMANERQFGDQRAEEGEEGVVIQIGIPDGVRASESIFCPLNLIST